MKKLIMALGVVALAATVQAATFRWNNSSPISPAGNDTGIISSGTVYLYKGSGQSDFLTGYIAAIAAGTTESYFTSATGFSGSAALTTNSKFASTTISGATISNGRIDWTESSTTSATEPTRQYYQVLVDGDNIYISDTITVTVKDTGNSAVAFNNNESRTALKQAADGYTTGGWYAVPEPTSGLLMLLGMAGLALRRRRA